MRRPETHGQTERANGTVDDALQHSVSLTMTDWDECLSLVQFAVDDAWQETVQETAHFLNFGRHPGPQFTMGLPSAHKVKVQNPAAGELAIKLQQLNAGAVRFMFAALNQERSITMTLNALKLHIK